MNKGKKLTCLLCLIKLACIMKEGKTPVLHTNYDWTVNLHWNPESKG